LNGKIILTFGFLLLLVNCGFASNGPQQDLENWTFIEVPSLAENFVAAFIDSNKGWCFETSNSPFLAYRLANGKWEFTPPQNNIFIQSAYPVSPEETWFTGYDANRYAYFVRREQNGIITDYDTPNTDRILHLAIISSEDIWAGCEWGEIMHFDGAQWRLVPCPMFGHIISLCMNNAHCGWASCNYRNKIFLLHWDGTQWRTKMSHTGHVPHLYMINDTLGWAFSGDSSLFKITCDTMAIVSPSSFVRDIIEITQPDEGNSLPIHRKGITVLRRQMAYVTFPDNQREILWPLTVDSKIQQNLYYFTSDGQVKFVYRKLQSPAESRSQFFAVSLVDNTEEYGVAMSDIDSDGDDDIYSINTSAGNHLLLFNGNSQISHDENFHFIDGAEHLNLLGLSRSRTGDAIFDMGATIADMDNDGDRDLFVTSMYAPNFLFENLSNKNFRDIASEAGACSPKTRSQVGIWGDVDNDGDVDLFMTNEDTTNILYLNNGFGKFREVTHEAGLTTQRSGKGATFGDVDNDGDLDLMVPCYGVRNRIYRNEGTFQNHGIPFFREMTAEWLPPEQDSLAKSSSAAFADFDNDGDLDLYVCNMGLTNRLYENNGSGQFSDITESAGLLDSSRTSSACFFDANNDGHLDLFLSNRGLNLFFRNCGNETFVRDKKSFELDHYCYSNGAACGDPDNDGDIDLYVAQNDAPSRYFKNQLNNNSFIEIKLSGTKSNRDAIGARAYLYPAGRLNEKEHLLGMREVNGGYGYGCMNSPTIHFGVDVARKYDVKIWFPSGIVITRTNLSPGNILTLAEQTGLSKWLTLHKRSALRYIKSTSYQYMGLIFIILTTGFIVSLKYLVNQRLIERRLNKYALFVPLMIYLLLSMLMRERSPVEAYILPTAISLLIFMGILFLEKKLTLKTNQERLAEELLLSCRIFDHGSWAATYLNQLQLFSVNIPPNETIGENASQKLTETITGFYHLVYKEIEHIAQLASETQIKQLQGEELNRQLLFLSENLNRIKIALAIKKGMSSEIWNNIYRLTDQIRLNIKDINNSVIGYFSCDAYEVLRDFSVLMHDRERGVFEINPSIPIGAEMNVCIKPGELAPIVENLIDNAIRATVDVPEPHIQIGHYHTDQFYFIEITDNGIGIPPKMHEAIFEEGFTTKSERSSGFGLSYSKTVIEKYGGKIQVARSGKNKGATFLIKLKRL